MTGRTTLVAGILMVVAAGLAIAMTPTRHVAEHGSRVNLDAMVPNQFGTWKVDRQVALQQVNPEVQVKLNRIYTEVLTRTYVNDQGYRVMLSIPYGEDQSDDLAAHDPEVCYPSQGFQTLSKRRELLHTLLGDVPVRRLESSLGQRHEPVTYWFTVGDRVVTDNIDRKLAQLRYAMKGEIPDGILFRVSSIDTDTSQAYRIQDGFISDLLHAVDQRGRERLIGKG